VSGDCCKPAPSGEGETCPVCGQEGLPVGYRTVAALTLGSVPARGSYRLCRTRPCAVVYFGADGTPRRGADVRFVPAAKVEGPEAVLVCFCLLHRRSELGSEGREEGASPLVDIIVGQIRNSGCACEVRNPSGRCCLADLRAEAVKGSPARRKVRRPTPQSSHLAFGRSQLGGEHPDPMPERSLLASEQRPPHPEQWLLRLEPSLLRLEP
jgi:hypothetical protein